jgi:creatinine amidohydrolase
MPVPYILRENNWKSVQSQPYDIAVLPWGATEAHNYHLPFGTDTIETEYIAGWQHPRPGNPAPG